MTEAQRKKITDIVNDLDRLRIELDTSDDDDDNSLATAIEEAINRLEEYL